MKEIKAYIHNHRIADLIRARSLGRAMQTQVPPARPQRQEFILYIALKLYYGAVKVCLNLQPDTK